MTTVLVVEDEIKLAQVIADYIKHEGWVAQQVHDGADVVNAVQSIGPDLIVLDLQLPHVDGLTLCKQLRMFSAVPIIMVTARVEEIDRLLGLELGADDYLCKPFSPRELIARIKAILRRTQSLSQARDRQLHLMPSQLRVNYNGNTIDLSAVEFALLQALVSTAPGILSRSQLMDRIYQDNHVVSDRTIDSHIKKLRKRLQELCPDDVIESVYGVGYRYSAPT
jgi:two-component system response regulator BaeR